MRPLIINRCRSVHVPRQFVDKWVKALARELKRRRLLTRGELVLVFVDPAEIRRLNRQYRKRNYATDVLSFEPTDANEFGQLVLCPQVLRRQADDTGLSVRHELGYMIVHGCLHLLGYDHETSRRDEKKMFHLQDRIFEKLVARGL